jgi:tRNA/tmRNA/rRNA uracil-C5-methylase (TrmA/RlmC/RlmD family)
VTNVEILSCDSSYFAYQILGKRKYVLNKAKQQQQKKKAVCKNGIPPSEKTVSVANDAIEYEFSTVLVDPPRAGLDKNTLQAIQQYDQIIYISCYPPRLLENLLEVMSMCFLQVSF